MENKAAQSTGTLLSNSSNLATDFRSLSLKYRAQEQKIHWFSFGQVPTPQLITCDKEGRITCEL